MKAESPSHCCNILSYLPPTPKQKANRCYYVEVEYHWGENDAICENKDGASLKNTLQ